MNDDREIFKVCINGKKYDCYKGFSKLIDSARRGSNKIPEINTVFSTAVIDNVMSHCNIPRVACPITELPNPREFRALREAYEYFMLKKTSDAYAFTVVLDDLISGGVLDLVMQI